MVADVYAGDNDQHWRSSTDAGSVDALFDIESDPDPDALLKIAGIVSLANRAPASGSVLTVPSGQLLIRLEVRSVTTTIQELIRRKLTQLTCVTRVDSHTTHRIPESST